MSTLHKVLYIIMVLLITQGYSGLLVQEIYRTTKGILRIKL